MNYWTADQQLALRDLNDAIDVARARFDGHEGVQARLYAMALHLDDLRGLDPNADDPNGQHERRGDAHGLDANLDHLEEHNDGMTDAEAMDHYRSIAEGRRGDP